MPHVSDNVSVIHGLNLALVTRSLKGSCLMNLFFLIDNANPYFTGHPINHFKC